MIGGFITTLLRVGLIVCALAVKSAMADECDMAIKVVQQYLALVAQEANTGFTDEAGSEL